MRKDPNTEAPLLSGKSPMNLVKALEHSAEVLYDRISLLLGISLYAFV